MLEHILATDQAEGQLEEPVVHKGVVEGHKQRCLKVKDNHYVAGFEANFSEIHLPANSCTTSSTVGILWWSQWVAAFRSFGPDTLIGCHLPPAIYQ